MQASSHGGLEAEGDVDVVQLALLTDEERQEGHWGGGGEEGERRNGWGTR